MAKVLALSLLLLLPLLLTSIFNRQHMKASLLVIRCIDLSILGVFFWKREGPIVCKELWWCGFLIEIDRNIDSVVEDSFSCPLLM